MFLYAGNVVKSDSFGRHSNIPKNEDKPKPDYKMLGILYYLNSLINNFNLENQELYNFSIHIINYRIYYKQHKITT